MTRELVEDLNNLVFYLNSHNFTRASRICLEALSLVKASPTPGKQPEDYSKTLSKLKEAVSALKKCASTTPPSNPGACTSEARRVHRYALLLSLLSTGRIRELTRARRAAYTSIALGLPTAALFGLSPIGAGLIFLGTLWTYMYFVRLKLVGWVVLTVTLVLLLPFTTNAVLYFSQALLDAGETQRVASALGVSYQVALILLVVLLVVAASSLMLGLYAIYKLIKYRAVFE